MNPSEAVAPLAPAPLPGAARPGGASTAVLAGSAVALACLLASTPVRDPALWGQLAAGRALAEGHLRPGDHLLDTPTPAWAGGCYPFYDLPLYLVFRVAGGAGVAAAGAGLAGLLAYLLLRSARPNGGPVAVGVAILLAVLALGPTLGVSPSLVSCVFLAWTLLLLGTTARAAEGGAGASRAGWLFPVLVAAWANVDAWGILGPLAAGLAALGERAAGRPRSARALGGLCLAGLVASLLSLNHLAAWDLTGLLSAEPAGGSVSPSVAAWIRHLPVATGLAYAVLTGLGLAALAGRRSEAWRQAPLWAAFLGLALWRPVAAPFFAVVAGPVAAAGLSARSSRTTVAAGRWAGVGARLAALAGVLLSVAAWPGWLQGPPYGRRVWAAEPDPSLREAAEQWGRWFADGAFGPGTRGLALSAEAGGYWAWFGPETAGPAPVGRASQSLFAEVRDGLLGGASPGATDWRQALRDRQIARLVVVHDAESEQAGRLAERLAADPDEWPLLYLRGRVAIFGWRDPKASGRDAWLAALRLDPDRVAFRPSGYEAPGTRPGRDPGGRRWWEPFIEPAPARPPGRDESSLWLFVFDARRPRYEARRRSLWVNGLSAGLAAGAGASAAGPGPLAADLAGRVATVREGWGAFSAAGDDGPPGALLLAVRAGRRAVHDDPEDGRSYFMLGESYLRLAQATRERAWRRQLPALDRIRRLQAITAFHQALTLRPDSPAAHGRLARLYRDYGSLDLALTHLERLVSITRARGPQPAQSADAFLEALAPLEEEKAALEREVRRRGQALDEGATGRPVLEVARQAVALGLPGRALETLLRSDTAEFGPKGAKLELDLLLWAGRVREVRDWATPDLRDSLGPLPYDELLSSLAAATGDYDAAGRHLLSIAAELQLGPADSRPPQRRSPTDATGAGRPPGASSVWAGNPQAHAAYDVARALLQTPVFDRNPGIQAQAALAGLIYLDELRLIADALASEADTRVVAGLLALEAGQIGPAVGQFRQAVRVARHAGRAAGDAGLDFSGRPVAEECLRLTERAAAGWP